MLRLFLLAIATLLATGCTSSYTLEMPTLHIDKLNPNVAVAVATPSNGHFESKTYANSGEMTAETVRRAFSKHSDSVTILKNCVSTDCWNSVDPTIYGYFVTPKIIHWEDRATEWSGILDKVEISLVVYDAKTRKKLATANYSGKSKWATFGGDHPQDLLPKPTNEIIDAMYKGEH